MAPSMRCRCGGGATTSTSILSGWGSRGWCTTFGKFFAFLLLPLLSWKSLCFEHRLLRVRSFPGTVHGLCPLHQQHGKVQAWFWSPRIQFKTFKSPVTVNSISCRCRRTRICRRFSELSGVSGTILSINFFFDTWILIGGAMLRPWVLAMFLLSTAPCTWLHDELFIYWQTTRTDN